MCIDVKFVKVLLKHMSEKLENAKLLSDEGKPDEVVYHQLGEAMKTYELLKVHMKGVYADERELNWDALVHSIL